MADTDFNAQVRETILHLLAEANRVPFLFVGSGMSRRYMGAEDWDGLLKWVCENAGSPMKPYFQYKLTAESEGDGKKNTVYPHIASLMERDFLDAINQPKFADWVETHRAEFESGISPMKIYIADHLSSFQPTLMTEELDILRKATRHVAGVITTNYDGLMESVFPKYDVYIRQEDLLFSPLMGIGEIYKIHGSATDPSSMVINERDYQRLREHQDYLTSKILTIFGEYPIIFLGYSLNDQDIREIISSIASCAGETRAREIAKRFIFVQYSDSRAIKSASYEVDNGQTVEMTVISTPDFAPIYEAIAKTNQRYAPKVLNQILRQLYKASYTGTGAESVVAVELSHMDELPPNKNVIVGVGVVDYGRKVTLSELHEDALFKNKQFSPELVIGEYLDAMLKQGGAPMYYYLRRYDGPLGQRTQKEIADKTTMEAYLNKTDRRIRETGRAKLQDKSVTGLISAFPNDAYKRLVLLYQSEIDLNELERLLKTVAKVRIESGEQLDYDLRKDIRIYDFLKYGVDYLKNSTPPQSPSSAPTLSAEPNGSAGVSPTSDPNHA